MPKPLQPRKPILYSGLSIKSQYFDMRVTKGLQLRRKVLFTKSRPHKVKTKVLPRKAKYRHKMGVIELPFEVRA